MLARRGRPEALALVVGLSTFIILARGSPLGLEAGIGTALLLAACGSATARRRRSRPTSALPAS